jgi:hypothetical protein
VDYDLIIFFKAVKQLDFKMAPVADSDLALSRLSLIEREDGPAFAASKERVTPMTCPR